MSSGINRWRQSLGQLAVDMRPLRESHDFRLLFGSQVVSQIGNQIRIVALPYQIFLLTHSSGMVGLLSLAQFVPLLLFSLLGGALADMVDRRRMLQFTQLGLTITSALLTLVALSGHASVLTLFVIAAGAAGIQAFDNPTRRAMIPRMVRRDHVSAAMALNQVLVQLSNVVGPAIGGIVIAAMGLGMAYALDAFSFLVVLAALLRIAPMPPEETGKQRPGLGHGIRSIAEGIGFLKGKQVLISAFLIDFNATFFGQPKALYPALATEIFHVGPQGLGLLYSASAVGALASALSSGWVGRIRRQGRAVIIMVVIWGLGITAFGLLTRRFWLALAMLALAGAADMVSAVLRSTILQLAVPDRLRGRLSAIHMMFTQGGPRLGDFEAGTVAQWTSIEFSVVSGGVAAALGAFAVLFGLPAFSRFDAYQAEADAAAHSL